MNQTKTTDDSGKVLRVPSDKKIKNKKSWHLELTINSILLDFENLL